MPRNGLKKSPNAKKILNLPNKYLLGNPVFGRKVAQMQGAEKMATGATFEVVRIAIFSATQQMGDFSFKHKLHSVKG